MPVWIAERALQISGGPGGILHIARNPLLPQRNLESSTHNAQPKDDSSRVKLK